jgi:hypothetical protein
MAEKVQHMLEVKRRIVKALDLEDLVGNDTSCCGRM